MDADAREPSGPTRRGRALRRVVGACLALVCVYGLLRGISLWRLGRIGLYDGEWIEREADPAAGFDWPYRVYVPASVLEREGDAPLRIWLRPNNTSEGATDTFETHDRDAKQLLEVSRREAERVEAIVIVPSFPRPGSDESLWGTHVLDAKTVRRERPMGRFDEQLLAMADAEITRLRERGEVVCERVLIDGFSASAMFTSRFMMLHPERVQAAAAGAPGGWPMVPVAAHEGRPLAYPAGVADYEARFGRPFPVEAVRDVPVFFFLGDHDTNDAVPYGDSFPRAVAEHVWELFGETPVERWDDAEALFEGYDARFQLYEDLGHDAPWAVRLDVLEFFAAHDERSTCTR